MEEGVAGWGLLVAAPIVGSFVGVVVRRLPADGAIVWARSRCEACGAALAPRDLVPLVSWLLARGRCRYCGARLGWFYPAIELAALAIAALALALDDPPRVWLDCLFGWWLLALAWIDLERWLLPNALTLPLIVAGLAAAALFDPGAVVDRALAAAIGYLGLRALAAIYRAARGRDGLGGGDAKLLAAAGAWVGLAALPQVILAAALAALAGAAALSVAGARLTAHSALPFGPFLAAAIWAVWLLGPL